MRHPINLVARPLFALLAVLLAFGTLLSAPSRPAYADSFERTVFKADFDAAPLGAITAPLAVEVGNVVAVTAPVAIARIEEEDDDDDDDDDDSKALTVSSGGVALLRFSNYPGALPQALNSRRYELKIEAEFVASANNLAGALVGLELADGTIFEIFSFGADGTLTRAGTSLGLRYQANKKVELRARFQLTAGRVEIILKSNGDDDDDDDDDSDEIRRIVTLPAAFNPNTINQVRFAAPAAATAIYALKKIEIKVEKEDEEDEPPAIIIIRPPDTGIEIENGVVFVVVTINISHGGGRAKGVFLVFDLDDDLLELADLSFLEGIGYVHEIRGRQVVIGVGQYNQLIHGSGVQFKLKFKVKGDGRGERPVRLSYQLRYSDSTGSREVRPVVINIVVPVIVITPPPVVVRPRLTIEAIDIRFRLRWERGGGLRIYGLPLTRAITRPNGIIVQYFERARFEYHPELEGTEYVILLGRLGAELGYARPPVAPPDDDAERVWYFVPTGHLIAAPFRGFWRERGGLLAFGYPIGPAFIDANGRLVQYFERTRLEYHPDLADTEYVILLGFLGEEALRESDDDDDDDDD